MYDLRHGLSNNLIRILGSYCDVLAHRYYCPPDPPPPPVIWEPSMRTHINPPRYINPSPYPLKTPGNH